MGDDFVPWGMVGGIGFSKISVRGMIFVSWGMIFVPWGRVGA